LTEKMIEQDKNQSDHKPQGNIFLQCIQIVYSLCSDISVRC
jgi:hypothetical protein